MPASTDHSCRCSTDWEGCSGIPADLPVFPAIRVEALIATIPVIPRGLAPDSCLGPLLRGAIGRQLDDLEATRLLPHDGTTPGWWLRVDPVDTTLQITLSTCGAWCRHLPLLGQALGQVRRLGLARSRELELGLPQFHPPIGLDNLVDHAGSLAQTATTLVSASPMVLTRDGQPVLARDLCLSDLLVAACKRLAQLAGLPRPCGLQFPPIPLAQARSAAIPWKGRRLPAALITLDLTAVPLPWRSLLIAGALANLGRFAAVGGGACGIARGGAP